MCKSNCPRCKVGAVSPKVSHGTSGFLQDKTGSTIVHTTAKTQARNEGKAFSALYNLYFDDSPRVWQRGTCHLAGQVLQLIISGSSGRSSFYIHYSTSASIDTTCDSNRTITTRGMARPCTPSSTCGADWPSHDPGGGGGERRLTVEVLLCTLHAPKAHINMS